MTRRYELGGRLLLILAFVAALAWLIPVRAQPGPLQTYTCSWDHDGVATDRYIITVDGAVVLSLVNSATICPDRTPRVCTTQLAMTTNVPHIVVVKALNVFGEASSDPFSAAPPGRPLGVVIR